MHSKTAKKCQRNAVRQRNADFHTTSLHEERLTAVIEALLAKGCTSVLDLGCGAGHLLLRLAAQPQFEKIMGVDQSGVALAEARALLACSQDQRAKTRVSLLQSSFTAFIPEMTGFDAAAMVETIEHIEPRRLSAVERGVFGTLQPQTIVITTPNREYNRLHGLPEGTLRHADHQFEWTRAKFTAWATGVAQRQGYQVDFAPIGTYHPRYGSSTQMAIFSKKAPPGIARKPEPGGCKTG
ncbi:MAG: methyltransferase domain-containing protein [Deltaproteobacteria bacterium]|nr:methyltransferase domain-containing protein [Deltaproteobacteria bacterium]NCP02450.1 methyltransferase domain-containing protein [Deltaproteobacteria bacterium]NCP77819.1 methyltransferase domain-containing protein [Desulfuromonadales bacterium]